MFEQGMGENGVKLTVGKREGVNARRCEPCINLLLSRTILSGSELGWFEIDSKHLSGRDQLSQINSNGSGTAATVQYAHSAMQERREECGMLTCLAAVRLSISRRVGSE
jgi:predicted adenine nucleotide alpha hydrolase (AANH) superfamily ATPase